MVTTVSSARFPVAIFAIATAALPVAVSSRSRLHVHTLTIFSLFFIQPLYFHRHATGKGGRGKWAGYVGLLRDGDARRDGVNFG